MKTNSRWLFRLIVSIMVVALIYLLLLIKPIWIWSLHLIWIGSIPFIISGFIGYLMHPLIKILEKNNMKRWIAITLIFFLFFGIGGVLLYFGATRAYEQFQELSGQAPLIFKRYQGYLQDLNNQLDSLPTSVKDSANIAVEQVELIVLSKVNDFVGKMEHIPSIVLTLTLIPFITFYLLKDTDQIKRFFLGFVPEKYESSVRSYFIEVNSSLGGFVRGQVVICTILGVLSSILFGLVGMSYPVILGIIIGLTNIIPNVGPLLGAIPALIIALTISKGMVIKVLIIVITLQIIEGNLVSPLVMGKTIHLHPLLVMIALFIGEEVAGFTGLILSIPVLAVIKVTYSHLKFHYKNHIEEHMSE